MISQRRPQADQKRWEPSPMAWFLLAFVTLVAFTRDGEPLAAEYGDEILAWLGRSAEQILEGSNDAQGVGR